MLKFFPVYEENIREEYGPQKWTKTKQKGKKTHNNNKKPSKKKNQKTHKTLNKQKNKHQKSQPTKTNCFSFHV